MKKRFILCFFIVLLMGDLAAHEVCRWADDRINICGEKCINKKELFEHWQHDHGLENSFFKNHKAPCLWMNNEVCAKLSATKTTLERHVNSKHIMYKQYICEDCVERFCRRDVLKSHYRKHDHDKNSNEDYLEDTEREEVLSDREEDSEWEAELARFAQLDRAAQIQELLRDFAAYEKEYGHDAAFCRRLRFLQ